MLSQEGERREKCLKWPKSGESGEKLRNRVRVACETRNTGEFHMVDVLSKLIS